MRKHRLLASVGAALFVAGSMQAQQIPDFMVGGRPIQVHAFGSQGFAYTNDNNWLTMKTSNGTAAMTDFGANISTNIADKFRVGAQIYDRNVGELGNWHPQLDWAQGDYKFKDWFGVRAGKVKTALGLLNDTQDMEFLHTWAIVPQSVYPLDLRALTIAHTGADIYGNVNLHKAGSVDYTVYAGLVSEDPQGGHFILVKSLGSDITSSSLRATGYDLRWNSPVSGLMLGTSLTLEREVYNSELTAFGNAPSEFWVSPARILSSYADYSHGNWHFNGEFRRDHVVGNILTFGQMSNLPLSDKAWFLTAAYRVNKRLELGTYHSRFYIDQSATPGTAGNHIYDQAVTARLDVATFCDLKVEGHFMDGYGDIYSSRGFYLIDNPAGLKPKTDALVLRAGFHF
jgi:hypothetical protein